MTQAKETDLGPLTWVKGEIDAALQRTAAALAEAAHAADPAEFRSCLNELKATPAFSRITPATYAQHTDGLAADPTVLVLLNRQPEFTMPVWDYLAVLVDDERVADGRAAHAKWHDTLQKIEQQTGVAPHIVIGVWGVESNFGQNLGGRPLVQSLATLSCFGRRQAYFRGEFASALRILQEGHIPADKLVGSWAGAFGQTQFMPSTFFRSAVDFDGDGRRDIVDTVPDALASTAAMILAAISGWQMMVSPSSRTRSLGTFSTTVRVFFQGFQLRRRSPQVSFSSRVTVSVQARVSSWIR